MLTLRDWCRDHWHASAAGLRSMARWVPLYAALAAVMFIGLLTASGGFGTEDWPSVGFYSAIFAIGAIAFRQIALILANYLERL